MQDKRGSSSHNACSQSETQRLEGESQTGGDEHHPLHHHDASISQSNITETSSLTHEMTNYNVNIQFDPVIPEAGKCTNLSLIVTEQKVGEPIRQFDIILDKLMHLIVVNKEDLLHFAHIYPKLDKKLELSILPTHSLKQVNTRCGLMPNQKAEYNSWQLLLPMLKVSLFILHPRSHMSKYG
ncbi:MAG: hypothetical protein M3261_01700 [Thermoproteota archaeon]|nr:hypothetical protein [Thermoproteota archaeon]